MFYEMEDLGLLDPLNDVDLFCIHFVYLPRVNLQLNHFMKSWNNHSLRTAGGFTPIQLWTRGIMYADSSVLEDVSSGLSIPSDYGVEDTGHINAFDSGSIIVPEVVADLDDDQMELLRTQFNPLTHSDYNGVDIYQAIHEIVDTMLQ